MLRIAFQPPNKRLAAQRAGRGLALEQGGLEASTAFSIVGNRGDGEGGDALAHEVPVPGSSELTLRSSSPPADAGQTFG
jgi:hypothetical protein